MMLLLFYAVARFELQEPAGLPEPDLMPGKKPAEAG
jgi:hypothetical protein